MATPPEYLKAHYEDMGKMRDMMETMKKQQQQRGVDKLIERMKTRATTHNSWRQMQGMQLFMHEVSHPGNKPFMIGLGVTCAFMMYAYTKGRGSNAAKEESKYWQRFHAKAKDNKHDDHGH